MNIHDMTEYAYKNGYKDGAKALAERLCDLSSKVAFGEKYEYREGIKYILAEMESERE